MLTAARSVRWEKEFESEIYQIEPDAKRADELLAGLDWVLARKPTHGVNIPGTDIWVDSVKDIPKMKHLFIYYKFSSIEIHYLDVICIPLKKKNE